jgi:hypothetical protein
MLMTVGMYETSHACTDRFDLVGAPCLQAEPSERNFGADAVRCPFADVLSGWVCRLGGTHAAFAPIIELSSGGGG